MTTKKKWYIAHEILYFERVAGPRRGSEKLTAWENLILIQAASAESAYKKAMGRGRINEEAVRIDGVDGRCKFLGLRDLVLVYDPLEDGAELEWRSMQVRRSALKGLLRRKAKLHAFGD